MAALATACHITPHDDRVDLTYPQSIDVDYLSAPRVILQVCIPDRTVSFVPMVLDLSRELPAGPHWALKPIAVPGGVADSAEKLAARTAYITRVTAGSLPDTRTSASLLRLIHVRETDISNGYARFGDVKNIGNGSHGGTAIALAGRTTSDQPVYRISTKARPQQLTAVSFAAPHRPGIVYWYRLPDHIPHTAFTSWNTPFTEEDRNVYPTGGRTVGYRLVQGGKVPSTAVSAHAPRVRYTLMSIIEEYDVQDRFWMRTQKAINHYKRSLKIPVTSKDWDAIHFIQDDPPVSPPCGS